MLTQADYETLGIRCPADVLFMMPDRVLGYVPISDISQAPLNQRVTFTAQVLGYRVVSLYICVMMRKTNGGLVFGVLFPKLSNRSSAPDTVPPHISSRMGVGAVLTMAGSVVETPPTLVADISGAISHVASISDRGELPPLEARFYKKRGVSGSAIGATVQSAKLHWPVPDIIHVPGLPTLGAAIKASTYATRAAFASTPAGKTMALADLLATRLMIKRARADQLTRPAPVIEPNSALRRRFLSGVCPYALTHGKNAVAAGLLFNAVDAPSVVVEGDVGTGKTLVAMLAMLDCVASDHHEDR